MRPTRSVNSGHRSPAYTTGQVIIIVIAAALGACDRKDTAPSGTAPENAFATPSSVDTAAGAEPSPSPATAEVGPPQIEFTHGSHDFGVVSDTKAYTHNFEFTNSGSGPLEIQNLKTSCSCTTAIAKPPEVAPGEAGVIEVTYSPSRRGRQTFVISVLSNATTEDVDKLTIHVTVDPFVAVEPDRLDLGIAPLHEEHKAWITVSCADPDLVVEDVRSRTSHVSAALADPGAPGGAPPSAARPGRAVIEVTVADDAPWGSLRGMITATARGTPVGAAEPFERKVQVPFVGSVFGDIHADPDRFQLRWITVGEPFERVIRLSRPSGEPFHILSATIKESNLPDLTVGIEPAEDSGDTAYEITLSGLPSKPGGTAVHGVVEITTDAPREALLKIPFGGAIRESEAP